ncbi:zinc-ribbon domain-containing protein [Butyrivibrio sp. DSM 10294]|uniref:LppM family (lipo)protein n=1 Tax=Butyrivibrio sp. DSM 10294 TaxID=2972457 RepID=UPI00234E6FBF|nr:zinc-ribbon domain-containing protein [Butyrivibrio sp. DSM 10294]MDC7294721.1 zinc-ribbon domain-containing protein [Butyrivibrio sp. DSM 10294]
MKKVFSMLMILICATFMTGCMRCATTVKIDKSGKADISIVMAFSDEFTGDSGDQYDSTLSEDMKGLEKEGWTISEYYDDGYTGYIATQEDVDLEKMDSRQDALQMKVKRSGSKYTIDWTLFDEDYYEQLVVYKDYMDAYDGYITAVIELPVAVTECNATDISDDERTLTWDLMELSGGQAIHVEYDLGDAESGSGSIGGFEVKDLYQMAGYLFAILLVVGGVIFYLINNSKKNKSMPYGQPMGAYGQQMNQQMRQPMNQPMGQPMSQQMNQPMSQQMSQPMSQPMSQQMMNQQMMNQQMNQQQMNQQVMNQQMNQQQMNQQVMNQQMMNQQVMNQQMMNQQQMNQQMMNQQQMNQQMMNQPVMNQPVMNQQVEQPISQQVEPQMNQSNEPTAAALVSVCPKCGATIKDGNSFCGICGFRIS